MLNSAISDFFFIQVSLHIFAEASYCYLDEQENLKFDVLILWNAGNTEYLAKLVENCSKNWKFDKNDRDKIVCTSAVNGEGHSRSGYKKLGEIEEVCAFYKDFHKVEEEHVEKLKQLKQKHFEPVTQ